MNTKIKLSNDFLDNLSDEEIHLLINIIPNNKLLQPIKKNPKEFKNETKGCRIDIKSKLLMDRLPNIYCDRIRRGDSNIINFIRRNITVEINVVNDHIAKKTLDKNFLNKMMLSNDIDKFAELIDIILKLLKPEYVRLFFKLIDQELSKEHYDYMNIRLQEAMIEQKLEEKITKKLEEEYEERIVDIQDYHKIEKQNQDEEIRKTIKELNHVELELSNEKKYSKTLIKEIENIEMQKNDEIDGLKKHIKKLDFQIDKLENEILKLKSEIEDKALIIESQNEELELTYTEYSIIAQKKWNIENKNLLKSLDILKKEYNDLEKTKNELTEIIKELEMKRVELENKISEFKEITYNFIDNIDEKLIEKALYNSLLKYNFNNLNVQNMHYEGTGLYIKNNEKEINVSKCTNIHDFAENIAINLENIGVKDIADEAANHIIGILATGMTPLICGYKAREIATAISASYSGETPYIITLPSGYTNSRELVEIYNSTDSNVILIEDAVGTMNENALMPLLRERSENGFLNKVLLLSTENLDSIKYIPFNLLNQVALVMINNYGMNHNTKYKVSDARDILQQFLPLNSFKDEYKIIKKLLFNLKFRDPYKILRSKIIAYSQKLSNPKVALQGYLRSELMFICSLNNTISDLENNITIYRLDDSLVEIIRSELDE